MNAGKIAKTVAQALAILLLVPLLLFACGLGLCGVITATGNLPVGGSSSLLYGLALIVAGIALGGAAIFVVVLLFRRRPPKP